MPVSPNSGRESDMATEGQLGSKARSEPRSCGSCVGFIQVLWGTSLILQWSSSVGRQQHILRTTENSTCLSIHVLTIPFPEQIAVPTVCIMILGALFLLSVSCLSK